jgi:hypothetical protein
MQIRGLPGKSFEQASTKWGRGDRQVGRTSRNADDDDDDDDDDEGPVVD